MSKQVVWDPANPLGRIKGESVKANTALRDYWLMGVGRSLRKLLELYGQRAVNEASTVFPPTTKWTTLSKWSHLHHWQKRIAAQKEIDDDLALAAYRAQHMSKDEVIARLSEQARADMADFAEVRTQQDLKKLPQSHLVKKITAHYRQDADGKVHGRIVLDLHDTQKALEMLGKYHGAFTDNLHVDGGLDVKGYTVVSPDDWDDEGD